MNIKSNTMGTVFLHGLLWGFLAPQTLLIAINLHGWNLIKGEANTAEVAVALQILLFESFIIVATILIFLLYTFRIIGINWKLILVSLTAHVAYMFFFLFNLSDAIPNTIQPWILSEGNIGRWNITLLMPGAFLSLYVLTRVSFSRVKKSTGNLLVILLTLGVPVIWYLIVSLMQPLWLGQFSTVISIIIATISVTVFLAAVIRLFDYMLHKDSSGRFVAKHYIIATLLGLAAPLGGLTLNDTIPFPADFQITIIYVLTVLNGLLLILKPSDSALSPFRLFLRCTFIPFIFYIFLVFLPFLPLSLFAILLVGAGLLMLTPLALGLFQAKVTKAEFDFSEIRIGTNKSVLIAVAGFLIMPSYFITQTYLDKSAIEISMNYFYSHDPAKPVLSDEQIERSARSLVQLRDRKMDAQLPYISGIYNSIVFGELVLPDKKIERMYRWLTNSKMSPQETSMFSSSGRSVSRSRSIGSVAPKRNITIQDIQQSTISDHKVSLHLTLKNNLADTHSLYVDKIHIPDGVFVTGLRLKIEGEWVEGRIFDKKTALWVFRKITEVRKDPALLHYVSTNVLELRVYPFPKMGIREVEVDFEFHSIIDSKISIGEHQIDLNPKFNVPSILSDKGKVLVTGMDALSFKRTPYLHFILDYSIGSKLSIDEYIVMISQVSDELNIPNFKITAANIGSSKQEKMPMLNIDERSKIDAHIQSIKLKERGGFWVQQAIAKEIVRTNNSLNEKNLSQVPVFVIIGGRPISNREKVKLTQWSWLIPDMKTWYRFNNGKLEGYSVAPNGEATFDSSLVVASKSGAKVHIFRANTSSIIEHIDNEKFQMFEPIKKRFVDVGADIEVSRLQNKPDTNWLTYAQSWTNWRTAHLDPSAIELKRIEFHALSQKNNFLLPLTSFIVVESESQWEILKRKEKQGLNNHSSLEFDNQEQTSEPPWWLMLICVLGYLFYRRKIIDA